MGAQVGGPPSRLRLQRVMSSPHRAASQGSPFFAPRTQVRVARSQTSGYWHSESQAWPTLGSVGRSQRAPSGPFTHAAPDSSQHGAPGPHGSP
jgi:hypothetical protein